MPSIIKKKSQTKNEKLCFFQMRYLRVCDTLGFAKEDAKPLTPFFGLKDGLQYSITNSISLAWQMAMQKRSCSGLYA